MITAWEWLVILIAIIVLILWGPSKIPELARALGKAKAEFEKASKEYLRELEEQPKTLKTKTSISDDEIIILMAKALGISTEGKTKEEIISEILANIKALKARSQS
jgi:sec-independent protein translocase protein TatA